MKNMIEKNFIIKNSIDLPLLLASSWQVVFILLSEMTTLRPHWLVKTDDADVFVVIIQTVIVEEVVEYSLSNELPTTPSINRAFFYYDYDFIYDLLLLLLLDSLLY